MTTTTLAERLAKRIHNMGPAHIPWEMLDESLRQELTRQMEIALAAEGVKARGGGGDA